MLSGWSVTADPAQYVARRPKVGINNWAGRLSLFLRCHSTHRGWVFDVDLRGIMKDLG